MKLLIDMNLSPAWADTLRGAGYEARHWIDCGEPTAADAQILSFAKAEGYVLLTQDLDFSSLLAAGGEDGPSVVQLRSGAIRPKDMAVSLLSALRIGAEELAIGAVITVGEQNMRVRMLPFSAKEQP